MTGIEEQLYTLVRRAVHDELVAMGFKAMEPEPDLERLADAARRFAVSTSWLEARHGAGELAFHGAGRMRRVRPADVRELMRTRQKRAPTGPTARATEILRSLSRRGEP